MKAMGVAIDDIVFLKSTFSKSICLLVVIDLLDQIVECVRTDISTRLLLR